MIYSKLKCFPTVNIKRHLLLPKNLLDLANLFLNFAGYLFTGTFTFQLGIIAQFPGDLLDLTLYFVKLAFRLVPIARFHGILLLDMK